jgi:hypothetical protein
MQVAGDKAAAILGVGGGVGSARAGAGTIGVVRIGVEVGREVGAKVGMEISAEVRMATAEDVGFKVRVSSSGKS